MVGITVSLNKKTEILKYISNKDWFLASRNQHDDLHTDILFHRVAVKGMRRFCGFSYSTTISVYKENEGSFYYLRNEAENICQKLIEKIKDNIGFGYSISSMTIDRVNKFQTIFDSIGDVSISNFNNLSMNMLIELYKLQYNLHSYVYETAWVAEVLQTPGCGLESYLENYLEEQGAAKSELSFLMSSLLEHERRSAFLEEEASLLHIADLIFQNSTNQENIEKIEWVKYSLKRVTKRFRYLGYHGYGDRKGYTYEYYKVRLQKILSNKEYYLDLKAKINSSRENRKLKSSLSKLYKIDSRHEHLFKIMSRFAFAKSVRRLAELKNFYYLDLLLEEVSQRCNVELNVLRFLTPEQVLGVMRSGNLKHSFLHKKEPDLAFYININGLECIYYDEHASAFIYSSMFQKKCSDEGVDEDFVVGKVASKGAIVRGKVIHAIRPTDDSLRQFAPGDILVAVDLDPDLTPYIIQAGAIVAEQGGITCHASIIARERGIPCIYGATGATTKLKQHEIAEVNTFCGEVRLLSNFKDSTLNREKKYPLIEHYKNIFISDDEVNKIISKQVFTTSLKLIKDLNVEVHSNEYGMKSARLGHIINLGINVPEGFVIPASALTIHIKKNDILSKMKGKKQSIQSIAIMMQNEIYQSVMDIELENQIRDYYCKMNTREVAVRSSAIAEDSMEASFAGQLSSFLFVCENELIDKIKKCWISWYSWRSITYQMGVSKMFLEPQIGVIIQKMVYPEIAGTVLTINPLERTDDIVIEFVFGIGNIVASGKIIPKKCVVNRNSFTLNYSLVTSNDYIDKIMQELGRVCLEIEKYFKYP